MALKMALLFVNTSMLQNIVSTSMKLIPMSVSSPAYNISHTHKACNGDGFCNYKKVQYVVVHIIARLKKMICVGLSGCEVPWDVKALQTTAARLTIKSNRKEPDQTSSSQTTVP